MLQLPYFRQLFFYSYKRFYWEEHFFFFFQSQCRVNKAFVCGKIYQYYTKLIVHLYEADIVAAVEIQDVIECQRKRLLSGPRNATGMSLAVLTPEINHVTLVCFIWHCHVTLYFLEVIQTQQKRIIKPGITQIRHVHCLGCMCLS